MGRSRAAATSTEHGRKKKEVKKVSAAHKGQSPFARNPNTPEKVCVCVGFQFSLSSLYVIYFREEIMGSETNPEYFNLKLNNNKIHIF